MTAFPSQIDTKTRENGEVLAPRFDENGLIACIAVDEPSGKILMVAWMNADALSRTIETGVMHYWSRSRSTLWKKGETSGQIQTVQRLRIDCDQDAIVAEVTVGGNGGACHTGNHTCFFREIVPNRDTPEKSFLKLVENPS